MLLNLPQPNESRLLTLEPYKTFNAQMKAIPRSELDGKLIEIPMSEDTTFCRSFLNEYFVSNPTVDMRFHRVSALSEKPRYLLELTCRWYIDEDAPLSYYNEAAAALEGQAMRMYIPNVALDVAVTLSCDFTLTTLALLPEEANLIDCGNLLLSHLVLMFAFENEEE